MTVQWITPDAVFDGGKLREGCAIGIADGIVQEIVPQPKGVRIQGIVSPGFVDLQVNGGGGVLLNNDPTVEGITKIVAAHRSVGTVALMPTVITDHPSVLNRAADAIAAAWGMPGVLGLHIEGPHIAFAKRGTHAAAHIRPLDADTIAVVARLVGADIPVMLTLAPEAATLAQISELAKMGVIVSLGHTDASASDMRAAIAAGASCGTHLFNAMSQMQARALGAVGALIQSSCFLGIICDGHHVADDMIALACRARPMADRMMLVSDAMATVGGGDRFRLYDQTITLKDGRLINNEGALAGAHVSQAEGVARLVSHCDLSQQDALRMAVSNPAACLNRLDLASVTGRRVTDLITLDERLGQCAGLGQ